MLSGCRTDGTKRIYYNPAPKPRTMAVTPFLNQSGSDFIDVMAMTDEFYFELQQVEGLVVVPVDRVLSELASLGLTKGIKSPDEAMALAEALEIDAVVAGAVTRYDPYYPPKLGITVQLYARQDSKVDQPAHHINPGDMARAGTTFRLSSTRPLQARAGITKVFDADQEQVVERIKEYAQNRAGLDRPTKWKTYITRRNFLRFVSHEVIGELLAQEENWFVAQKAIEE